MFSREFKDFDDLAHGVLKIAIIFFIGIQDVYRIPRIYFIAKITIITSLRLLFYNESMSGSSPYIK